MREETTAGRDARGKRHVREEMCEGIETCKGRNMRGCKVQGAREETRVGRDVRGKRCVREEMGRGIEDA